VFPAFSLFDNVWVAAFATGPSWKGLLWKNSSKFPQADERVRQALSDVGLFDKKEQLGQKLKSSDLVILTADHKLFDMDFIVKQTSLLLDTRNAAKKYQGTGKIYKI